MAFSRSQSSFSLRPTYDSAFIVACSNVRGAFFFMNGPFQDRRTHYSTNRPRRPQVSRFELNLLERQTACCKMCHHHLRALPSSLAAASLHHNFQPTKKHMYFGCLQFCVPHPIS